jgi:hypothetical protein
MKKTSTVQLVRNATLKIRYAGHTMLIDPVLADKGTLISALGVNKTPRVHLTIPIQDIIGGVDMVLLTHNHIDHYEPSVPTHLPKEIPFYVQPQDADAIRNDGFTNVIPIEEIKTIDGISIYLLYYCLYVCYSGEYGRDEAHGADTCLACLTHRFQTAFNAYGVVHICAELLVERIDRP